MTGDTMMITAEQYDRLIKIDGAYAGLHITTHYERTLHHIQDRSEDITSMKETVARHMRIVREDERWLHTNKRCARTMPDGARKTAQRLINGYARRASGRRKEWEHHARVLKQMVRLQKEYRIIRDETEVSQ